MNSLPKRLKFARKQAGLSLAQVARELFTSRYAIASIEEGKSSVREGDLARFADLYLVSIDWLSGQTKDEGNSGEFVQLAARQISQVRSQDLDKVLDFLKTVRG